MTGVAFIRLACLLALVAALSVAGCGGSSGDNGGGSDGGNGGANGGGGNGGANGGGGNGGGGNGGGGNGGGGNGGGGNGGDGNPTTSSRVLLGASFHGESPVQFGIVAVGESSGAEITVRNTVEARVITGVQTTGVNASEFPVDAGTCNAGTELAPGSECTLHVTFTPVAPGKRSATLAVNASPGGGGTTLEGTGKTP
jgi:Abnormal spindle-like microcephaly-assoc'd, ASPM-SPD-2-Hydin